jgi:intergrase/recombinase
LNPRLPHCEAETKVSALPSVDWKGFEDWLRREHSSRTASDMLRYVRKYNRCLLTGNLSELHTLSKDTRLHTLSSLSALSKFLGVHEDFLRLVKNYGLKWTVRNDDLLIARFTKAQDHSTIFDWVKLVKVKCPELEDFMDFMTATGLRFDEAVQSYNLIIKLSKEGKLKEYFNDETETLEHFRFKEVFIRRTKKAFISFIHKEQVQKITENKPLNLFSVQSKVRRRCKRLAFGDIREVHATLSTKHLKESEIDFLHGRVSTSVFMRNYFNPALISDLKERVFKTIDELDLLS